MSSYRDSDFDKLIRISLQSALRQAEPDPNTWSSIETRLAMQQSIAPALPGWQSWKTLTITFLLRIEESIFSSPTWHDRLSERRMQLLTQFSALPGNNAIPLTVVWTSLWRRVKLFHQDHLLDKNPDIWAIYHLLVVQNNSQALSSGKNFILAIGVSVQILLSCQ